MQAGQWLCWIPGGLLLGAGLAALVAAEALRRRHGKTVLALSPDTLQFANASSATPWHSFDAFELEQRPFSLTLVFSVAAGHRAPPLGPTTLKALAAPDATRVAGGLRVRLWLLNPMLDGQRLDFAALTDLLYGYLDAAQARHTLGKLFPAAHRSGAVRQSMGQ
ncbi:hypothetical protein SAMN05216588_11160 [Pseudomonas flavescens]|uniref:Uncharacterized protein n=1 Tax=Phytopseudomonas flavescens TaxID=29435 RepID=A0A1G8HQH6_9GAMM|nr:hypothetical protein [Pseudomonas flavescens]SDI08933.1 hypothetical protein SAMN05216588_11160 [Pseudomonas flavescens]